MVVFQDTVFDQSSTILSCLPRSPRVLLLFIKVINLQLLAAFFLYRESDDAASCLFFCGETKQHGDFKNFFLQ